MTDVPEPPKELLDYLQEPEPEPELPLIVLTYREGLALLEVFREWSSAGRPSQHEGDIKTLFEFDVRCAMYDILTTIIPTGTAINKCDRATIAEGKKILGVLAARLSQDEAMLRRTFGE